MNITKEQALEIAAGDIDIAVSDIHAYTVELEEDDGILYYDVEIRADKLYDFEIRVSDGKILERDSEILYGGTNATNPPDGKIPIETALDFLFTNIQKIPDDGSGNSQIPRKDVTNLEWEIDIDDGTPHYDISFHYQGMEYECEVGLYRLYLHHSSEPID